MTIRKLWLALVGLSTLNQVVFAVTEQMQNLAKPCAMGAAADNNNPDCAPAPAPVAMPPGGAQASPPVVFSQPSGARNAGPVPVPSAELLKMQATMQGMNPAQWGSTVEVGVGGALVFSGGGYILGATLIADGGLRLFSPTRAGLVERGIVLGNSAQVSLQKLMPKI